MDIANLLATWRRHESLNHLLLAAIPEVGLCAIPLLKGGKPGRGREVARVYSHLVVVRMSFMRKAEKELAGELPGLDKDIEPTQADLTLALTGSSKAVEARLSTAVEDNALIRKHSPLNFMAYLISHESHHRGQIMLALKQNGFAMGDEVKWGLWGSWFAD